MKNNFELSPLTYFCIIVAALLSSCGEKITEVYDYDTFIEGDYTKICSDSNNAIVGGYTEKISYAEDEIVRVYFQTLDSCENMIFIRNEQSKPLYKFLTETFPQDTNPDQPWKNGFGFKKNAAFKMPKLDPGFYYMENKVPMIAKSKRAHKITIVHPTNTLNAYNSAGGKSLYSNRSTDNTESNIITFKRPQPLLDNYISKEWYAWMAENFNDINYIIDRDLDDWTYLDSTDLLIIPGHNEYWTRKARRNFDRFVDQGGNVLILSGNTMWFQVRYDEDKLICYKNHDEDLSAPDSLKTWGWNSTALNYPIVQSIGADFDKGGYGKKPEDIGWDGFKITAANHPIFKDLNAKNGDIIPMRSNEYDGTLLKSFNTDSLPEIDKDSLKFHDITLLAYDIGYRGGNTVATAISFKKTERSGRVINLAATNWCSRHSITGPHSDKIRTVIKNAVEFLQN